MLVITTDGEVLDGKSSLTGREIAAVVLLREDGSEDLKERLEINILPRMRDTSPSELLSLGEDCLRKYRNRHPLQSA